MARDRAGDGSVTDGWWDFRPLVPQLPWPDVRGKRCLDVGTADGFWAFELPLARLDARRDGGEWFVFNPRGMRKALERAGWRVERQTGVLRDKTDLDWKHRLGPRGRACAILARA